MGGAIGRHITNWTIYHPELVTPLRRISKELKEWLVGLNNGVKAQLTDFVLERHDNVRVPATALRHLMAHGHFAPAGKIALRKTEIIAVETLCDDLIAEIERRFAGWLDGVSGDAGP